MRDHKFEYMLMKGGKVIRKEVFKLTDAKPGYALIDGMSEVFREFTGLLDRHGKEIYEGDILKASNNRVFIVEWIEEEAMFHASGKMVFVHPCHWSDCEVIGSIYEHPELLSK